jgi:diaminobutyrate-2-oxoglutarate transaminase
MGHVSNQGFELESAVRSYSRNFPVEFVEAEGAYVRDTQGREYIDFLAGCGSLNYGHNPPSLKKALQEYISGNGPVMSMDLVTPARTRFINNFRSIILEPRGLNYLLQFPGPTGANAVEAAIKLARKVTGRTNVIAFTNGFHGCSLGALSLTGNRLQRRGSVPLLPGVTRFPYCGYFGDDDDALALLRKLLADPSSGIDEPAAIVLEAIQGEGGLSVASSKWLKGLSEISREFGCLLVVDEVQAGCGRSGQFFSFENAAIVPDIVCMAKAISGFGLPMSLLLIRPQIDVWEPGEHNGTFRGNNYAFVTANAALESYWSDPQFKLLLANNCLFLDRRISALADTFDLGIKGRGMMRGLEFENGARAAQIQSICFRKGLILETCGNHDQVLKFLPPINLSETIYETALDTVEDALHEMKRQTSALR